MRPIHLLLCAGVMLLLAACGGPPTKVLGEAEVALNGAILAKKCAPEDYAAAEKMYAKAQKLNEEGKYAEAEQAGLAAKKLAIAARDKAVANKDECLKPKNAVSGLDPNQYIDPTPAGSNIGVPDEGLQTIYFDYNAFALTDQARQTMTKNAAWLRANGNARVTVEGHCDERGSTEYNLALGEKRALVVKSYLQNLGVDTSRLAVLSYGEENPQDFGNTEAAYARNRRVEFKVRSLE